MHTSNSDIRARARYLLDENIFGKDWLKSAIFSMALILFTSLVGGVFYLLSEWLLLPILVEYVLPYSFLLYIVLIVLISLFEAIVLNLLIGPIAIGFSAVHLELERGSGVVRIRRFFDGFSNTFLENVQLGVMYLLHSFLWTLLFFVPGVYVSYSYAMIYHVKYDNPEFTWQQCFDESERLMEGNRWRYFKLQCSFIGWYILGLFAGFGFGLFWVNPYNQVSTAVFYDTIKEEKELEADLLD